MKPETNHSTMNVNNLCSSKLWELLSRTSRSDISPLDRLRVERELIKRRHYLEELSRLRDQQRH